MTKTTWFEVYEFVDNDMINGTQTIAEFSTIEEAEKFISEHDNYYIDQWEGNEDGSGIPQRVF